jgi:hypothetical protein
LGAALGSIAGVAVGLGVIKLFEALGSRWLAARR